MAHNNDFDVYAIPPAERLILAQELLASLIAEAAPLSEAQMEEIDRRIAEIDSGTVTCEPWETVRAELLSCLK
jgi:putative addiction module component (TIGR02574 family)